MTAGSEIVTLTPINDVYIIANLKETQIKKYSQNNLLLSKLMLFLPMFFRKSEIYRRTK
ncbi:hypothetical protein IC611_01575 [Proteus mirabilis]